MPGPNKILNVAGIGINNEKDIEIVGQTERGYVTFQLPGEASAILSALFSAYACELGVGGKEEKEHANLFLNGYEFREPRDGMCPVLFKCKPDLHLWFSLPVAALEDLGKAFLGVAEIAAKQDDEGNSPSREPKPSPDNSVSS